jgi:hypothetical protein
MMYFCVCKVNSHKGDNRVNRGGSWNNNARNCRVSNRNNNTPDNRNNNLGFRLVSSPRSSIDGRMASTDQAVVLFPCVQGTKNPASTTGSKRQYE